MHDTRDTKKTNTIRAVKGDVKVKNAKGIKVARGKNAAYKTEEQDPKQHPYLYERLRFS